MIILPNKNLLYNGCYTNEVPANIFSSALGEANWIIKRYVTGNNGTKAELGCPDVGCPQSLWDRSAKVPSYKRVISVRGLFGT